MNSFSVFKRALVALIVVAGSVVSAQSVQAGLTITLNDGSGIDTVANNVAATSFTGANFTYDNVWNISVVTSVAHNALSPTTSTLQTTVIVTRVAGTQGEGGGSNLTVVASYDGFTAPTGTAAQNFALTNAESETTAMGTPSVQSSSSYVSAPAATQTASSGPISGISANSTSAPTVFPGPVPASGSTFELTNTTVISSTTVNDSIQTTVTTSLTTPEPASMIVWSLMACGFGGVSLRRRKTASTVVA